MRFLRWTLGSIMIGVVGTWIAARPVAPDAFYTPPADASSAPGALLRQEPFDRGVPAGARGWRMLYATTRAGGASAVASAIVLATRDAPGEPRPVVAWTHGTTGIVPGCAPSLLDDPFANVPALQPLLEQGWVYVATDYVGQGTPGPHPYLVGEGEARSALDAIRAARRLDGVRTSDRVVVWGHSQGGHAALWTGIVAPTYAPDVPLAGVAAVAPASDLRPLLEAAQHTLVGRIMSSFVLRAYGEAYADVAFDAYVPGWRRLVAGDMAGRCLAGRKALFSVAEALLIGGTIFATPPGAGPLGERLAQNTPDHALPSPLLIAQGLADDLVLPEIQQRFVRRRCEAGQALAYRTYPGRDHLSVVAPDSPMTPDLVQWTRDRIAGAAPPNDCGVRSQ